MGEEETNLGSPNAKLHHGTKHPAEDDPPSGFVSGQRGSRFGEEGSGHGDA